MHSIVSKTKVFDLKLIISEIIESKKLNSVAIVGKDVNSLMDNDFLLNNEKTIYLCPKIENISSCKLKCSNENDWFDFPLFYKSILWEEPQVMIFLDEMKEGQDTLLFQELSSRGIRMIGHINEENTKITFENQLKDMGFEDLNFIHNMIKFV